MNHTEYIQAKALFKPHSRASTLRQSIYAILTKEPSTEFLLSELAEKCSVKANVVYSAVKTLVRKGFAERTRKVIPTPTEKKPDKVRRLMGIKLVPAWSKNRSESWHKA